MYAAANNVDNLISTIDYNKKQIDGSLDEVLPMGDLKAKLEAFDWLVLEEKKGKLDLFSQRVLKNINTSNKSNYYSNPSLIIWFFF